MMDKPKRNRATKDLKERRVAQVLELMIKRRFSDRKIQDALVQSEGISAKTAKRYIQEAHKCLEQIGSQSCDVERGLLWERSDALFELIQNSDNPDPRLMIQALRTQLQVHKTHPHLTKGEFTHESAPPTTPALSDELKKSLERLGLFESDKKS